MFDDQQFSKDLKIQKIKYQLQEALDWELMQQHLNLLQVFPLSSLHTTAQKNAFWINVCLLYTSPSPRDRTRSRMPSSA